MTFRTFHWHDLLPLRDDIDRMTAAVNASYALVFGGVPHMMNGNACATGYTDFTQQLCWLNAEAVHVRAAEQFVFTVYLAAHERAHARWTDYHEHDFDQVDAAGTPVVTIGGAPVYDRALHQTWNILEDERIERLLGRDFPQLHPYLRAGSTSLLTLVRPATAIDHPWEVLQHILRRRVAQRAGRITPCRLSPANRALLRQCEPLLENAFSATSSRQVVTIARAVLTLLQLAADQVPMLDLLSAQCGERSAGSGADEDKSEGCTESEGRLSDPMTDGANDVTHQATHRMQQLGYTPGQRSPGKIEPAAYDELQRSVRPYFARIRPLFAVVPVRRRVAHESSGGRLSIRAARVDLRTPFRVETMPVSSGPVALTLVIDDSASMTDAHGGTTGEREGKRMAMLCLDALPPPHRVRVVLAPSGRDVADPSFGEMSRARIAGYTSRDGTAYAEVLQTELRRMQSVSGRFTRYLVLVGDGATGPEDLRACRALVRASRETGVHVVGIAIPIAIPSAIPSAIPARDVTPAFFPTVFGAHYVTLDGMSSLVSQMHQMLLRIAHRARRSS